MKALVRNKGETVTENDNVIGIYWDTGAPLTNPAWAGGPYRLVQDYQEPVEQDAETLPDTCSSESEGAVTESPSTVTYGGKEYTLEELKKLIG